MQYDASTPEEYLDLIPEERKAPMKKLREVILENLPKDFEEGMNYKMIGYYVPHSVYPPGYHCDPELPLPFMNIACQKNFIGVYHMGVYANPELYDWFVTQYAKHCKYKLDMGKSCVRLKKMDDIPYDLIGELASKMTAKEWIELYEKNYKK
ncbi:MAG: DUF1801 domain-containing protein [Bacteroidia bacterium]|nr:DUF1801 domain-containing protein [Bacteroidia bacterium]NNF30715.1 DUF1801 domain-containing protein [Flavobacteriaceae bacterium]MBT8277240.1 DUF1801 domain-containing protein [Bacteroidia bacterium]NNJ80765.1 DUF1801 domain-containing protein [Flavobacteriaceae bacterium]NNK54840.1 DUF1801 domain-containing protein [Flavobacteriaceae bacterium]